MKTIYLQAEMCVATQRDIVCFHCKQKFADGDEVKQFVANSIYKWHTHRDSFEVLHSWHVIQHEYLIYFHQKCFEELYGEKEKRLRKKKLISRRCNRTIQERTK